MRNPRFTTNQQVRVTRSPPLSKLQALLLEGPRLARLAGRIGTIQLTYKPRGENGDEPPVYGVAFEDSFYAIGEDRLEAT